MIRERERKDYSLKIMTVIREREREDCSLLMMIVTREKKLQSVDDDSD